MAAPELLEAKAPRRRSRIHGGPRCVLELARIRGKVDAAAAHRDNTTEQLRFLHRLADSLGALVHEGALLFPTWNRDPRDRLRARKRPVKMF